MSRDEPMSRRRRRNTALAVAALAVIAAFAGPTLYHRIVHPLKYESAIARAGARYEVDPYLIAAVINAESGFDRTGVSKKGAIGLMQLMPATAEEARRSSRKTTSVPSPVENPETLKDPEVNIELGTHHLGKLIDRYEEPEWALAAYNAGATNADKWRREATSSESLDSIGYPATRSYVAKVLRERTEYRRLYPDAFDSAPAE